MFLGIDIGTSGVKAVVIDETGRVLEEGRAALTVSRPAPLWSEQDPDDWVTAAEAAVLQLSPGARAEVEAIGLAGQMHGLTALGADDQPLRPAILWNDGRSFAECAKLESMADVVAITGNRAMPGFTAPKLLWLRAHEPETAGRIVKILLPKDYVRLFLTGDHASDMSDSAGTLWLDVAARDWSDALLDACGLSRSHMPLLFEGSAVTGALRAEVAHRWGMGRVPVAAGGGDNAAGAVGAGVVREGDAFLSLGTSGVIFVAGSRFVANPAKGVHSFCHALPGRWHQMSVMLSAASAVDWAAESFGFDGPAALHAAAEARGRPTDGEIFLPYLTGERTPHNDPRAQGVLFGLTASTDRGALAQAALEGVAFGLADGLDALAAASGKPRELTVIGGGARSNYWGAILAAAFDRPLVYREGAAVGPALGAARLAQLAITGMPADEICVAPPETFRIEPDAALRERLAARRPLFQALYQDLAPRFRENAQ